MKPPFTRPPLIWDCGGLLSSHCWDILTYSLYNLLNKALPFSHQLMAFLVFRSSPSAPPPGADDGPPPVPSHLWASYVRRLESDEPRWPRAQCAHMVQVSVNFFHLQRYSGDAFPARCADARAVRHSLGRRVTFKSK